MENYSLRSFVVPDCFGGRQGPWLWFSVPPLPADSPTLTEGSTVVPPDVWKQG